MALYFVRSPTRKSKVQDIQTLQGHLGSMFVTTAFLDRFSGGLTSNIAMTIGMATEPCLARLHTHSAEAAFPMASVAAAAHDICAATRVIDKESLEEMLAAVHKQFEVVSDYNAADKAFALETLEHVFSLAAESAWDALREVQAGYPSSGGDFAVWKHERFWRKHRNVDKAS